MYYVRTTGGSMMAITPRSKASVTVKKNPVAKQAVSTLKQSKKKKS